MGRRFIPWQKKRGHRRTGSQVAGSVGEGALFAGLMLGGSAALIGLVTSRLIAIPGLSSLNTGSGLWLSVVVLASLVLTGTGGLIWTVVHARTSAERRTAIAGRAADLDPLSGGLPLPNDYPAIPRGETLFDSPGVRLRYRLPCSTSPTWSLLAIGTLSLMVNGLIAGLIVVLLNGVVAERTPWLLLLLLIPLTYGAVKLTWFFLQTLSEAVRIGPTSVEVSDLPFYPGRRYDLCLVQAGRMSLRSLKLMLSCDESATFREGTDVRIEKRRVSMQKVLQCVPTEVVPGAPFVHQGEMVLAKDVMHSFQAKSNSIRWNLIVQGELEKGGHFEREFPIVVFPVAGHEERD